MFGMQEKLCMRLFLITAWLIYNIRELFRYAIATFAREYNFIAFQLLKKRMLLFNHLAFDDFDHSPLILSLLKKCEKLHGIFESTEFIRTLESFCRCLPQCQLLHTLLISHGQLAQKFYEPNMQLNCKSMKVKSSVHH